MNKSKIYRVGVIGLGVFGSRHAVVSAKFPFYELVGVSDIKPEVVNRVAAQLGVQGYTRYQQMIDECKLDAVIVALSDQYHQEPVGYAAERGISIFLEKPIANTLENAGLILDAVGKNRVKLMVGHTLRYDPRYMAVQAAIKEGKLGELIHVFARRNATTTSGRRLEGRVEAAIFQGVHDIDFLQWISGSRITKVYSECASRVLTDLNVSDTVMATLHFENGTIGLLEQSWGLPAGMPSALDAALEVVGTQGAAYLDLRSQSISMFVNGKYSQPDIIYGLPDMHFLYDEHDWFVSYLNDDVEPKISGEEAYAALKVADAIVRSGKSGEIVYLTD